jgi:hypothetical protein
VIPTVEVEVDWAVDYDRLSRLTDDDLESSPFGTRGFAPSVAIVASWGEAIELLERERAALARIAAAAGDEQEFEQLASEEDVIVDDPWEGPVSVDFGVLSACVALGAAGFATAASCRGHPKPNAWSSHPLLLLTAERRRTRILEELARKTNCGLKSTENHRLALWAQSIEAVLALSEAIVENQKRFDRIPLPAALRRARGIPDRSEGRRRKRSRGQDSLF